MTESEKKPRAPRKFRTLEETMLEALDVAEAKLKASEPKLFAAEETARELRREHTARTNEINRMCKLAGRKDLSERAREVGVVV